MYAVLLTGGATPGSVAAAKGASQVENWSVIGRGSDKNTGITCQLQGLKDTLGL
jgi:hypothetical protein